MTSAPNPPAFGGKRAAAWGRPAAGATGPLSGLGKSGARRVEPGAWECLDEAAAGAAGSAEPSLIAEARLARAEACWLRADAEAARREAELADEVAASGNSWERGAIGVWLSRTGAPRLPKGQPAAAHVLQTKGDWLGAAGRCEQLGS